MNAGQSDTIWISPAYTGTVQTSQDKEANIAMSNRRLIAILTVIIVIAGTACWLVKHREQQPLENLALTEAMHSVYYTPQYVALHNNYFTRQGLNVHLKVAAGDADSALALAEGRAQVALFSSEQVVQMASQGRNIAPVAFALLCQRDGTALLGRVPGLSSFDWQTMAGKTVIGQPPDGTAELVLAATLKRQRITDAQILQNVVQSSAPKVFITGTGDFVQLFEPSSTELAESGAGYLATPLAAASNLLPLAAYHTTTQVIKEHPLLLQKFTDAIHQAQLWMENRPALEIAVCIAPYFPDTQLTLLATAIEHYQQLGIWATTPVIEPELLDHLQELMISTGRLDQAVSSEQSLNSTFATRAVENGK